MVQVRNFFMYVPIMNIRSTALIHMYVYVRIYILFVSAYMYMHLEIILNIFHYDPLDCKASSCLLCFLLFLLIDLLWC